MEYAPQDAPRDGTQNGTDSGLTLRELEAQSTELAGHLNAANHRWLVLIAEFDRRNGWSDGVTQSCAHWLSWKCGLDLGAAREKVRVGKAIESLPKISAAMANGRLSYAKVRALTRLATPGTEDVLLNVALNGPPITWRRSCGSSAVFKKWRSYRARRGSTHNAGSRIFTITTARWW